MHFILKTISRKSSRPMLCVICNLAAIGNLLGVLIVLVPTKRKDLVKIVFRAMVCGNGACFLTGCITGTFNLKGKESDFQRTGFLIFFSNVIVVKS